MDVAGVPGAENGLAVGVETCEQAYDHATDQVWQLKSDGRIVNRLSGKCLTVKEGRSESGAPLILFDCAGTAQARMAGQLWELMPACEKQPGLFKPCACKDNQVPNFASGGCMDCAEGQLLGRHLHSCFFSCPLFLRRQQL